MMKDLLPQIVSHGVMTLFRVLASELLDCLSVPADILKSESLLENTLVGFACVQTGTPLFVREPKLMLESLALILDV
jgi:hypothetical protein